jgi:hypothetical protein
MSEKETKYVSLSNKNATYWGRTGYTKEDLVRLFERVRILERTVSSLDRKVNKPQRIAHVLDILKEPHIWSYVERRTNADFFDRSELLTEKKIKRVLRGKLTLYQKEEGA